jgi:hypothetical protein
MPDSRGSVLLLGNYRPTICLVRELKALGYRTVVGRGGGEGGAEHSRFTDEVWDHPPCDGRHFVRALAALLARRPDITVVFPWARLRPRGRRGARPASGRPRLRDPTAAVIEATLDKVAAYALARSVGVPVAPYAVVDAPSALGARCAAIGYPVVLRPLDAAGGLAGEKALIVASEAELDRALAASTRAHRGILAQRYVTGRRHNLYFAARMGRLVRLLEAVIERTDRLDDTGLAVEGRSIEPTPSSRGTPSAWPRRSTTPGRLRAVPRRPAERCDVVPRGEPPDRRQPRDRRGRGARARRTLDHPRGDGSAGRPVHVRHAGAALRVDVRRSPVASSVRSRTASHSVRRCAGLSVCCARSSRRTCT